MIKKIYIMIILLFTVLVSASCVGNIEINELAIVTAVGIDKDGDKIIVTIEAIDPTAEGKEEGDSKLSGVMYIQGEGKTPYEAIRNTTLFFDRKLFFSHSNIIICGEEFAKGGIINIMDFFLRDYGPREGAYMIVAKGARADEILGVSTGIEQATGSYIQKTLENFQYNGKCIAIPVREFLRYYYNQSNEVVIGLVEKIEKPELDITQKKESPIKYFLDVSGGAAFKEDKLIGYFTEDEMIGFNFIVGDIEEALINFKTPIKIDIDKKIVGEHHGYTSVQVVNAITAKNITVKEGNIHLDLDVKIKGNLIEVEQALDINKSNILDDIEDACSKKIKELISNTLDKGQKEFKQDNFSIGVLLHRQHPKLWKEIVDDWHSIFKDISYSVNVDTDIVKSGITNLPMNLKERDE